jgi:hypothetical protein
MSSQTWVLQVYTPQQALFLSSLNNGKPVIAQSYCTSEEEDIGKKRSNKELPIDIVGKVKKTRFELNKIT